MSDVEVRLIASTPDKDTQPIDYASVQVMHFARDLQADVDAVSIIRGLLNVAVSLSFQQGISNREVERLVRAYADNVDRLYAFATTHGQG